MNLGRCVQLDLKVMAFLFVPELTVGLAVFASLAVSRSANDVIYRAQLRKT